MKPKNTKLEDINRHYQTILCWVKSNPERAAYIIIRLKSVYEDYLKEVLKE